MDMDIDTSESGPSDQHHNRSMVESEVMDSSLLYKYTVGQNTEPFDEWLQHNAPSGVDRQDGVDWIIVLRPVYREEPYSPHVVELCNEWEQIQTSGRPINKENIFSLAKKYGCTCGKWLFHVETGPKADHLWSIVSKAVVNNRIPSPEAKISSSDFEDDRYKHVVCVYNYNFFDEEEVFLLEQALRQIGIKCPLYYKPDVFTHLGVYRHNQWNIRPTIYASNYDIVTGKSKIESH